MEKLKGNKSDYLVNLVIYGFKHSGKTAYAKFLADTLGVTCIDLDELISDIYYEEYNKLLAAPDIFDILGESDFRNIENQALNKLLDVSHTIVSASGGSILNENNVAIYKKVGKLIYLNANKETLNQRETQFHEEGLITPGELKYQFDDIYTKRAAVYKQVADIEVTVHDKTAEEIIAELTEHWHLLQDGDA